MVVIVPSFALKTPAKLSCLLVALVVTLLFSVVTLVTIGIKLEELMVAKAASGSLLDNSAYLPRGFNGLLTSMELPDTMPLFVRAFKVLSTDYGMFTVVRVVVFVIVLPPSVFAITLIIVGDDDVS